MKATDSSWAYISAALQDGFISPDSQTHFGANDAVTLNMVDNMYWTWLNMGHVSYQPGQSVTGWAQSIGLNPSGVANTSPLTSAEVTQVLGNLEALTHGFAKTSDGTATLWRIYYPPQDEYNATFSQLTVSGNPVYSQSSASQVIDKVYQFFNSITVTPSGDNLVISMPSTVNTPYFAYAGTSGDIHYNLFNGDGASWVSAPVFDGRNIVAADLPANVTQVLLRVPKTSGVTLSFNEQIPSLGGSVTLGEIEISWTSSGVVVKRLSLN